MAENIRLIMGFEDFDGDFGWFSFGVRDERVLLT
jgi:hypothetical protein